MCLLLNDILCTLEYLAFAFYIIEIESLWTNTSWTILMHATTCICWTFERCASILQRKQLSCTTAGSIVTFRTICCTVEGKWSEEDFFMFEWKLPQFSSSLEQSEAPSQTKDSGIHWLFEHRNSPGWQVLVTDLWQFTSCSSSPEVQSYCSIVEWLDWS